MINQTNRIYIFYLYLLMNLYYAIYFCYDGYLGGDFNGQYEARTAPLVNALLLIVSSFYIVSKFYFEFCERLIPQRNLVDANNNLIDFAFILISIYYFISVVFFNVGVVGIDAESNNAPKIFYYLSSLFQPGFIISIYLFYNVINAKFYYKLILLLFILTSLLSGATYQIILLFFLYLSFKKSVGQPIPIVKLLLWIIVGLLASPIIRVLKVVLILSYQQACHECSLSFSDNFFSYVGPDDDYLATYLYFLNRAVERFQMVANVAFFIDDSNGFLSYLSNNGFIDYYKQHWIITLLSSLFSGLPSDNQSIQTLFAEYINGQNNWAAQIGLVSFIFVYDIPNIIIFSVCILLLIMLTVFLSKYFISSSFVNELSWVMVLILCLHGWIAPFILYLQALLVFGFILMACLCKRY
ncbi:oligosaccharide repeat unit polymerase [Enterobacter roggenkampii]|uniref:oligosaccharide repeat unit polymerase n=1 Tax=Enterobacter roggenkampii TaxID=1812935 RepID=UPI001C708DCC|nr:oligosaccharide repeat unit polymerase [Enterobacter roggenkampii]MBW9393708.1 oligosaccharide repeat unit polymerase [Enterobacter roggenkampii]